MRILYLNNNPNLTMDQWALESEPMTNPKLVAEPESTDYSTALAQIGSCISTTAPSSTIS